MISNIVLNRYQGRNCVFPTKHQKAKALALPFKAALALNLSELVIDTDQFGTFTGEIERKRSPLETAILKARLGMKTSSSLLGLASEGSFGPHPFAPLFAGCQEILVFIDDELGIEIKETLVSTQTNFNHIVVNSVEDLDSFLTRIGFPSHAVILRPNKTDSSLLKKMSGLLNKNERHRLIFKGIKDKSALMQAFDACQKNSLDKMVQVETDMRAHMNPTRMKVLRKIGVKMAKRIQTTCPRCNCPGFGITQSAGALLCEICKYPSDRPLFEIHTCPKCPFEERHLRKDGIKHLEQKFCQICNP